MKRSMKLAAKHLTVAVDLAMDSLTVSHAFADELGYCLSLLEGLIEEVEGYEKEEEMNK